MLPRFGLGRLFMRPKIPLKSWLRPTRRFQHHSPDPEDFLLPGQKSAQNILKGFIGANAVVFLAWQVATTRSNADSADMVKTKEKMARELNDKFVFRADDITQGRYYSAILHTFSHMSIMHFGFNMMAMWSLGNGIISSLPQMTGARFLILCMGSAMGSAISTYTHKKSRGIPNGSVGASGLVSGIAAAVALREPFAKMGFILIPISFPAWFLISSFFGYSAYAIATYDPRNPPMLDHAGHLGGAVFGALYYIFALRRGRIPMRWK
ncbi:hypothetical protein IWZ03DRAFT_95977 [Phyllosticta citriasiana]|uniref:Peptidase S54 rhomboid domain-containing protein n=1 Tax=Phyllosticta citriasiana TaxID=595635 RepID=A0ABR1KTU7_9PEZI